MPLLKYGNASRCAVVEYVGDVLVGKSLLRFVIGFHFQDIEGFKMCVAETILTTY